MTTKEFAPNLPGIALPSKDSLAILVIKEFGVRKAKSLQVATIHRNTQCQFILLLSKDGELVACAQHTELLGDYLKVAGTRSFETSRTFYQEDLNASCSSVVPFFDYLES